jgi:hypothetical protein
MFQQKIFVFCKRNLKLNLNLTPIFLALRDEIRYLVNVLISVQHLDGETIGVAQCCQDKHSRKQRSRGIGIFLSVAEGGHFSEPILSASVNDCSRQEITHYLGTIRREGVPLVRSIQSTLS